jgi:hypothetical protein
VRRVGNNLGGHFSAPLATRKVHVHSSRQRTTNGNVEAISKSGQEKVEMHVYSLFPSVGGKAWGDRATRVKELGI